MAALQNDAPVIKKTGFNKRNVKQAGRVDMTPMVDLGFLLITFFIFTATMGDPTTMDMNMPDSKGPDMPTAASGSLTLIIDSSGKIYSYEGLFKPGETYPKLLLEGGLRNLIIDKKKSVIAAYKGDPACETAARKAAQDIADCAQQKMFVLIKPTPDAAYSSIVNALDEMTINKIKRYALTDADPAELAAIAR